VWDFLFYFFSVFLFIYLDPKTNRARGIWAFAELSLSPPVRNAVRWLAISYPRLPVQLAVAGKPVTAVWNNEMTVCSIAF
jgi:hypothetical protein